MNTRLRFLAGCCSIAAALLLSVFLFYRWNYPYGHRTCAVPCTVNALRIYAIQNGGWFPQSSTNGLEALARFAMESKDFRRFAAGLSGNEKLAEALIREGIPLTTEASSWVYFPSFRIDDPRVCIIWESVEGIGSSGKKAAGHAVGYNDGSVEQIVPSDWQAFQATQARNRSQILQTRRVQ